MNAAEKLSMRFEDSAEKIILLALLDFKRHAQGDDVLSLKPGAKHEEAIFIKITPRDETITTYAFVAAWLAFVDTNPYLNEKGRFRDTRINPLFEKLVEASAEVDEEGSKKKEFEKVRPLLGKEVGGMPINYIGEVVFLEPSLGAVIRIADKTVESRDLPPYAVIPADKLLPLGAMKVGEYWAFESAKLYKLHGDGTVRGAIIIGPATEHNGCLVTFARKI